MDRFKRFGLIAAVAALALLVPTRAASQTEAQVIEVVVSLTDLAAPIVNVSVPEMTPIVNIEVPEQPAPVVNVPAGAPPTIVVEPSSTPAPQVVYKDRTVEVEVERIVETPACVDVGRLSHFDLANWITVAYPGEPWGLSGSDYDGLVWYGDSPKPTLNEIIDAYLAAVTAGC